MDDVAAVPRIDSQSSDTEAEAKAEAVVAVAVAAVMMDDGRSKVVADLGRFFVPRPLSTRYPMQECGWCACAESLLLQMLECVVRAGMQVCCAYAGACVCLDSVWLEGMSRSCRSVAAAEAAADAVRQSVSQPSIAGHRARRTASHALRMSSSRACLSDRLFEADLTVAAVPVAAAAYAYTAAASDAAQCGLAAALDWGSRRQW